MSFNINKFMSIYWAVGHTINYCREVNEIDMLDFARLSGDFNPLHLDETIASKSIFKKRVAHGMFIASFFSKLLGDKNYGLSGIYLNQSLKFIGPVYINDSVDVYIELTKINKIRSVLTFRTFCKVGEQLVVDGSAEVYVG